MTDIPTDSQQQLKCDPYQVILALVAEQLAGPSIPPVFKDLLAAAWIAVDALPGKEWSERWYWCCEHHPQHPVMRLGQALDASPAELLALFWGVAVDTDPLQARLVAFLHGDDQRSQLSLGLVGRLALCMGHGPLPAAMAKIYAGPVTEAGALSVKAHDGRALPEAILSVPPRIVLALADHAPRWPAELVQNNLPQLPDRLRNAALQQVAAARIVDAEILLIRCGNPAEGLAAAAALADGHYLALDNPDAASLEGLGVYCRLTNKMPVIQLTLGPAEERVLPHLHGWDDVVVVITGPDGRVVPVRSGCCEWTLPALHDNERTTLWREAIGPEGAALESWHRYGPARLAELARGARHEAALARRDAPTGQDIRRAVWHREGRGLGTLAQAVPGRIPDEALVVHEDLRGELQVLWERCRRRGGLAEGLGIAVRERYRGGASALFHGPSGTGKTLAATWLATRLGLPLYRVDLAACMSKYIGETEKNLSELLAKAEDDEVVLFFDEADALFGRRTDVRDSNDRYANAQTNYLLQRLENYRGLVILTSNSRARLDSAFVRRLDHIIEFPPPGPVERQGLWRSHLPSGHGLSDGDIGNLVAMSDLAGGHIRNAVMRARLVASAQDRSIVVADVAQALVAEYRKLGGSIPGGLRDLR